MGKVIDCSKLVRTKARHPLMGMGIDGGKINDPQPCTEIEAV